MFPLVSPGVIKLCRFCVVYNQSSSRTIFIKSFLLKSHYEVLGVDRHATQADIKAAYYKLSMIYHPDRNDTIEAAESFRTITEAYEVIGNFKLRKMYDRGLLGDAVGNENRRSYTNYTPTSSSFKNKPMQKGRSTTYNFDEWAQFHYGQEFSKRKAAKMRYEEKHNQESTHRLNSKNENIVYVIFALTAVAFMVTFNFGNPLDEPSTSKKNINSDK